MAVLAILVVNPQVVSYLSFDGQMEFIMPIVLPLNVLHYKILKLSIHEHFQFFFSRLVENLVARFNTSMSSCSNS